jgi:hypothetical protein
MTGREKQLKTKKYPKAEEFEFNHIALLAFVGTFTIMLRKQRIGKSTDSLSNLEKKFWNL